MSHIPLALRRRVVERAASKCEYCLRPQWFSVLNHHVDHIVAVKHGGETNEDNLCLCCAHCNRHKGSDLTSIDPLTGQITILFHPRRHRWSEHFRLRDGEIEGITPEGRTTVRILRFNDPDQVEARVQLMASGRYP